MPLRTRPTTTAFEQSNEKGSTVCEKKANLSLPGKFKI